MARSLSNYALAPLAFSILASSGCAVLTPPLENPVIEDSAHAKLTRGKVSLFSTTAARRSVLAIFGKGDVTPKVCAEAPPDTADSLISALALSAQLQASKGAEAEAAASASLQRSLATTVSALVNRSQGLQLYRDGAFHLCIGWQNGVITGDEFATKHSELLKTTQTLILAEIPSLDAQRAEQAAKLAQASMATAEAAAARATQAEARLGASDQPTAPTTPTTPTTTTAPTAPAAPMSPVNDSSLSDPPATGPEHR